MVVAAVMNVGATYMSAGAGSASVSFFHGLQVALMLTIMFNLVQFVFWRCKQTRRGTCWQVHEPTFWTLVSAILTNVQPMLILITGSWMMCCAPCAELKLEDKCAKAGITRTFPPFGNGDLRECSGNGNLFWDDSYCTGAKLATFPTKASGWVIQVLCTWGGFCFMFVGILQATQLHKKVVKRWRAIRSGRT